MDQKGGECPPCKGGGAWPRNMDPPVVRRKGKRKTIILPGKGKKQDSVSLLRGRGKEGGQRCSCPGAGETAMGGGGGGEDEVTPFS